LNYSKIRVVQSDRRITPSGCHNGKHRYGLHLLWDGTIYRGIWATG